MSFCNIEQLQVGVSENITAFYCATDDFPLCYGLCPNPDLAGIGVRAAFYSQSFMNALLIWLSPDDSAAGAWASTVLTGALVIPALRAKMKRELTLHHATLVLNFATLSTVASVAVAPMVPIWRVLRKSKGEEEIAFRKVLEERARGRIILSVALGAQIVLQWIWTVLMFVDPFYAQNPCSGETKIVYFGRFHTATEINNQIASWAVWLLLCFSSSLIFGVVMVFSCPSSVHETPLKYNDIKGDKSSLKGKLLYQAKCWKYFLYPKGSPDLLERWLIRISQLVALTIVVGFTVYTELQITANHLLSGENEIWSFSQSAAVFLALSPIWPIAIAWLRKNDTPLLPVHYSRLSHCEEHPPDSTNGTTCMKGGGQHYMVLRSPPDSFGRKRGKDFALKTQDDYYDGSAPTIQVDDSAISDQDDGSVASHSKIRHRRRSDQASSEYSHATLVDEDSENIPLTSFSDGSSTLSPHWNGEFNRRR
ncbi:hypothetical protein M407DRAFT_24750 [Tulasnella calospora MUT 4182]|uniref:Uncharacterized protein n=1 Tax=Tulasnella calospora MUT 4182 TaxID=1051891 RepID=A0A0C3LWY7_9AGAM|nr:hypothetical protein M407DRAFT_24750 [Tulasnella calospora MUT 4182]